MSKKLTLSVIIASYNSKKTIEGCLTSLETQTTDKDFNIILVDSSTDGTAKLVEERFPEVNLYRFSGRKFPGDARNYGISKAKGEIIAFTDTDCTVDKNWINEIIEAHKAYPEHPVIGGTVDNGNPESYVGWASYFCEFSQWMPQLPKCQLIEIPSCCLSIKRWAFDKYGPFLEGGYCSDTAFNWRLGSDGYKPLFIPSIKTYHININRLGNFLRKEVIHGRFFAKMRVLEKEFSLLNRVAFFTITPLLPFLLFYRIIKRVLQHRIYLKHFILSSPLVFSGLLLWSFGESVGYAKVKRNEDG